MADETESTFPTTLDVFPRPTPYDNANTVGVKHAAMHSLTGDAIEKMQVLLTESVAYGIVAPTTAPTNTENTAFYMDGVLDQLYYWNVTAQEWRRLI
jgi:hypothetical protein